MHSHHSQEAASGSQSQSHFQRQPSRLHEDTTDADQQPQSQSQSRSNSHSGEDHIKEHAHQGWSLLRNKVLPKATEGGTAPGPGKVSAMNSSTITAVPITTELLAGQLPVMMLKTWLDRDEDGRKAVPVLLGNMRFRVGDSVGLREGNASGREMFKVECEYGDGAVRWVSSTSLLCPYSSFANSGLARLARSKCMC